MFGIRQHILKNGTTVLAVSLSLDYARKELLSSSHSNILTAVNSQGISGMHASRSCVFVDGPLQDYFISTSRELILYEFPSMWLLRLVSVFMSLASSCSALAPSGAWDRFNLAPASRTVYPTAIHSMNGTVKEANLLIDNKGKATFIGIGSWVALDFGIEVGGLISMNFDSVTSTSSLVLSFTESPLFIRPTASDDSSYPSANTTYDGVLQVNAPLKTGDWIQPAAALRGGFRYLTIVSMSTAPTTVSNISCSISFMPHVDDMKAYSGYFFASDPLSQDEDFLTKVWYAGAYTVQTNTVPLDTGRRVPFAPAGSWANDARLGVAGPIIVDGAKRDRAVWPGAHSGYL
ncbi:unnamed protein product [Cyclocybe aegerita]|uniref:Uncharacterized protein n=1 Tax=Cyclocybe aegerita TaxID=1973307 RepID=A0A8S0X1C5_CYCAE|nr:unnamed protein product [Cyclocybe aegerita]